MDGIRAKLAVRHEVRPALRNGGRISFRLVAIIAIICAAACGRGDARPDDDSLASATDSVTAVRADSTARAKQDSINRAQPGYIVDSILPVEEELRRFRADLPDAPTRLVGGTDNRDALVAAFLHAVQARDSAALARLALTRAEFAYLVYPSSPYTVTPYRQAPWLAVRADFA